MAFVHFINTLSTYTYVIRLLVLTVQQFGTSPPISLNLRISPFLAYYYSSIGNSDGWECHI